MLAQWTAVSDIESTRKRAFVESNEAREGRLREHYENALTDRTAGDRPAARDALLTVVDELDNLPAQRPHKRTRTATADDESGVAPWITALKHAALRNLGDIHAEEGDHYAAYNAYARALHEDETAFIVWLRAARAAGEAGWLHAARRAYERAQALRPRSLLFGSAYRAVLLAIGDDDADVNPEPLDEEVCNEARRLLLNRAVGASEERGALEEAAQLEKKVHLPEGRWCPLIDAIGGVLANRLGHGKHRSSVPVGAAIQVLVDGHVKARIDTMIHEENGDANPKVGAKVRFANANGVSKQPNGTTAAGEGKRPAGKEQPEKTQPDPRYSLRQRGEVPAGQEVEGTDGAFLDDMATILRMARDINFSLGDSDEDVEQSDESVSQESKEIVEISDEIPRNSWTTPTTEDEELKEVVAFCVELNTLNSGPFDALHRVLLYLAEKESNQYLSEIAQAWISLRNYGTINIPGNARVSLCVADALLVSGCKAKKNRDKKFAEAERILAVVALYLGEHSLQNNEDRIRMLCMRLRSEWLSTHIAEKDDKLSDAFTNAQHCLDTAKELLDEEAIELGEIAGPEFSGRKIDVIVNQLEKCARRLKAASELQNAKDEIAGSNSKDKERARKAASLLAPSIYEAIRRFRFNLWQVGAAERAVEKASGIHSPDGVNEREELEKRLAVYAQACKSGNDTVGEILATAVRFRLDLATYWAQLARERPANRRRGHVDNNEAPSAILEETSKKIRIYAANIKTIASDFEKALLSPTMQPYDECGWSSEQVFEVVVTSIIALCEVFARSIPLIARVPSTTTMPTVQKNMRLAFTRCILAFYRCIEMRIKIATVPPAKVVPSKWMLPTVAFCLRTLADRGCCREEGTSGFLIKMYMSNLGTRLQELVRALPYKSQTVANAVVRVDLTDECGNTMDSTTSLIRTNLSSLTYLWDDIRIVRQQLAQCFKCLYRIPDLETPTHPSEDVSSLTWLYHGCTASRAVGLTFISGAVNPTLPKMNYDNCRTLYFLYRRRLMAQLRTEGSKAKCREIFQEIVNCLPSEKPFPQVPSLRFDSLDAIVTAAVEENANMKETCMRSVETLKSEWAAAKKTANKTSRAALSPAEVVQNSVLHFESYVLNALGSLMAYEIEFKKNRNIARRKGPKDFVEKLINASLDCATALRYRPWSVGAWIVLSRIFVELADVALDEREMVLRTFGNFEPEDLELTNITDMNDSAEKVVLKAEVCFTFAEAIVDSGWADSEGEYRSDVSALHVYSEARESIEDKMWSGFGDDGDLFGALGLTNETSSRPCLPDERHPKNVAWGKADRLKAAIYFGRAALHAIRAREDRYWYNHWEMNTLELTRLGKRKRHVPEHVMVSAELEFDYLQAGLELVSSLELPSDESNDEEAWRRDRGVLRKQTWYYMLRIAKLKRKMGAPPEEFLPLFAAAYQENERMRKEGGGRVDIELLYQLHAARAKVLLAAGDSPDLPLLRTIAAYSFIEGNKARLEDATNVEDPRKCVASDILEGLDACGSKSGTQHAEHFYKASYYRAVLFRNVYRQTANATTVLSRFFRTDGVARTGDIPQRGYFYLIWNYRHTDTGYEVSLETERKLVRWRHKMLGLYGALLREKSQRNMFSGIVYRLKRRALDDLPVDGALLDDFIMAYAQLTRNEVLRAHPMTVEACKQSFRRTYDLFVEMLRLNSGARRIPNHLERGIPCGAEPERLIESARPLCQLTIANALHLEHLRLNSVTSETTLDTAAVRGLQHKGTSNSCSKETLMHYSKTMAHCVKLWKTDGKLGKLVWRRVEEYGGSANSDIAGKGVSNGDHSAINTPARIP